MYALQDVPGKGKGLVATTKIPKGTRILSEEPVTSPDYETGHMRQLEASICRQVDALDEEQRQSFLSMHNIHAYANAAEEYMGIFQTNALPSDDGGEGSIFMHALPNR